MELLIIEAEESSSGKFVLSLMDNLGAVHFQNKLDLLVARWDQMQPTCEVDRIG